MKIAQKVAVYSNAHRNTSGMGFGPRNLVLAGLARDLGLKHWIGSGVFELHHPKRRAPLLVLPQ